MLLYTMMFAFFIWRIKLLLGRQRNTNITTGIFRDLEDEANSFYLKDSEVKIWTTFSNENYDNDDNPYAKIEVEYKTRLPVG